MKIENFHHIIRAAAAITGENVFVVVGSQAILAQFPDAPAELSRSQELDIFPKFRPDLAELIEELSARVDDFFDDRENSEITARAPSPVKRKRRP